MKKLARLTIAITIVLLVLFVLTPFQDVHASANGLPIPWLDDIVAGLEANLVKILQDLMKGIGVILWAILKLSGATGLLGENFSLLFGNVITEAINAVISGDIRIIIRGSFMVSLGLLGLSMLAKPVWPDLNVVSFQRAAIWGIVLQAYLLNAPNIYATLETFRVDLAEQVASAVSSGSVPGCSGSTVETILCICGTTPAEIINPTLNDLPATIPPYGGTETIDELYNHCVYNPPYYYGDSQCDPDDPQGDPWEVMGYTQDALGKQIISLILGFLVLAYGILQLALGLAAGMMFVLFPVAGIFAFYAPLESFPAGIIRNYISIFLKSIVLLTLSAIVIRLFTVAAGNLLSMAAVGVISLLLCGIMAKEALGSLMGSIDFVGNSVSSIGAGFGLGGAAGAAALPGAAPSMSSTGTSDMAGSMMKAPVTGAKAALGAAIGAGTGGLGLAAGAMAAQGGAGFGELALMGNTATAILGKNAGRGFMAGAGVVTAKKTLGSQSPTAKPKQGQPLVPKLPGGKPAPITRKPVMPGGATMMPKGVKTGLPASVNAIQSIQNTGLVDSTDWTAGSQRQLGATASPFVPHDTTFDIMQKSHDLATQWEGEGRSPILEDGTLDPQFVDEARKQSPKSAKALGVKQDKQNVPREQQLSFTQAAALGVTTQRTIPPRQAMQGYARAVKNMDETNFSTALEDELGIDHASFFGEQAQRAEQVAGQMQQAGLANEDGRRLIEIVHGDLERSPNLTAAQFRDRRHDRMGQWDNATGDPETTDHIVEGLANLGPAQKTTVREIPKVAPPPAPAAAPRPKKLTQPPSSPPPPPPPATPKPAQPAPPPAATPKPAQPTPSPAAAPRITQSTPPPSTPKPAQPTPSPAATPEAAQPAPSPAAAPKAEQKQEPDPALVKQLQTWRSDTAGQIEKRPFHVLTNATLENIATAKPQTLKELEAVKGIGPKKIEQYGQAILDITEAPAGESAPPPAASSPPISPEPPAEPPA